jgi:acetoin utilization protein AcuC
MNPVPFFYSNALLGYNMGPNHPMKPIRLKMTVDLLRSYGLFDSALRITEPTPVTTEPELLATHDQNYLEVLDRLDDGRMFSSARRFGFGTGDNPVFPGIASASRLYTGASLDAAQAVLEGAPVAFNIAGGLHHAHWSAAAGFCVLDDPAVAARRLRTQFDRVAYVDIDVHHGDGVQESFYEDPTVLTISLHESGRTLYPGTGFTKEIGTGAGQGYSVNLPFAPWTPDDVWLGAWRASALPILKAFDPGAIVLQMGADAHILDPLAHLCLTAQGWLEAVKDVQALGKPIVAVGGGGYNMTTTPRMWTLAVATLAGVTLPDATPTGYAYHRDIPALTDHKIPRVADEEQEEAQQFADRSVAELKALLFSRFGL